MLYCASVVNEYVLIIAEILLEFPQLDQMSLDTYTFLLRDVAVEIC